MLILEPYLKHTYLSRTVPLFLQELILQGKEISPQASHSILGQQPVGQRILGNSLHAETFELLHHLTTQGR